MVKIFLNRDNATPPLAPPSVPATAQVHGNTSPAAPNTNHNSDNHVRPETTVNAVGPAPVRTRRRSTVYLLESDSEPEEPETRKESEAASARVSPSKSATPLPDAIDIIDISDETDTIASHDASLADFKCPICLEPPEMFCVTECGHMYCSDCVFTALSSTNKANKVKGQCSICRADVRYDSVLFMEMKLQETALEEERLMKEQAENQPAKKRRRKNEQPPAVPVS